MTRLQIGSLFYLYVEDVASWQKVLWLLGPISTHVSRRGSWRASISHSNLSYAQEGLQMWRTMAINELRVYIVQEMSSAPHIHGSLSQRTSSCGQSNFHFIIVASYTSYIFAQNVTQYTQQTTTTNRLNTVITSPVLQSVYGLVQHMSWLSSRWWKDVVRCKTTYLSHNSLKCQRNL